MKAKKVMSRHQTQDFLCYFTVKIAENEQNDGKTPKPN